MKIEAYKKPVDVIVDGKVEGRPVMLRKFSIGAFQRWQEAAVQDNQIGTVQAAFECVVSPDLKPAFTPDEVENCIEGSDVLELYEAVLEHNDIGTNTD